MIRKHLEQLEARENPATADLSGGTLTFTGGPASNLTVYTSGLFYYLTDPSGPITVTGGTVFGNGTTTVRARIADVSKIDATGCDVVSLRNVAAGDSASIQAGTVNICSNAPVNTGNINGILGPVDVSGGSLVVGNQSQLSGSYSVGITSTQITGILPGGNAIGLSGSFASIRVVGSNTASVPESFTIDNPPGPLQIDGNGGAEVFNVMANAFPVTLNGGAGADVFSIGFGDLSTILGGIAIDGGTGANAINIDGSDGPAANAVVTGSTVSGFASVSYQSNGGTTTLSLTAPTAGGSTVAVGILPSFVTLDLLGDWTVM